MPHTSSILSEDHILACIARHFPDTPEHVLLDRGDDCAIIATHGALCVSTDIFSEHVHFRRTYSTFEDIGYKALAVNISDLAAQGANPTAFTVGLSVPPDVDMENLDQLFSGMASLAHEHHIPLVGGDIARAEALHICITIMGESPIPLKRGQAQVGDIIFGIGALGLARAGFEALECEGLAAITHFPLACQAHLRPKARLADGRRLAGLATALAFESGYSAKDACYGRVPAYTIGRLALMDVSDGLARDLPRLIQGAQGKHLIQGAQGKGSNLGASITLGMPNLDLVNYLKKYKPSVTPHEYMTLGGEDYALLGTCDPQYAALIMATIAEATLLGTVTDKATFLCNGKALPSGFDHFAY